MKTRFVAMLMALLMALTFSVPAWAQEDIAISNEIGLQVEDEAKDETEKPAAMELSIALTPDKVVPDGTLTCSVTLTNNGAAKLAAQVSCRLPANVVPADRALAGYDQATNTVSWLVEVEASQSATRAFDAVLPADAAAGATYPFAASVSADGLDLTAEATATAVNYSLALSAKANVSRAMPGDAVSYSIALTNSGGAPATGVQLVSQVPPKMTVDSVTITEGGAVDSDNRISWTLDIEPGKTVTLAFKAAIPATAAAGDAFTVTAAALDLTASARVMVYEDEPKLSISKKVNNRTPEPGASVKYTITVANDGDADAYDVEVVDTLPGALEVVRSSISDGGSYQSGKRRIVWTVDVPANDEVKLTLRAYVPEDAEDGDTYVNRARIADVGSAKATIVVTEDAVPKTGYGDGDAIVPAAWWKTNPYTADPAADGEAARDEPLPPVQEAFAQLYNQNNDLVGWLKVANLVDLPIVQAGNNDFYMYHDFDGNEDEAGALFLDERNSLVPGDQHLLIYGHNMKSGAMFGSLSEYRSIDFLKANPVFSFQPVYDAEPTEYVVVAVLDASMDVGNAEYLKIRKPNFDDEAEGKNFLESVKSFSYYDIPVEWSETDPLLSLVTCSYYQDNGRLLVVARPLREGETVDGVAALMAQAKAVSGARGSARS